MRAQGFLRSVQHQRVWLQVEVFGSAGKEDPPSLCSVSPPCIVWGLEGTGNAPTHRECSHIPLRACPAGWGPTDTPRVSNPSWDFGSSVLGGGVIQGILPK